MREVRDRLRTLDQIQAPDLRDRIRSWEPRAPRAERSLRRVGIALLAFVVAAAGIAFAIRTFRATELPTRLATTIENGKIGFTALINRAESTAATWVVNPDGTGLGKLSRTSGIGGEFGPAWSPDGSKVAFYVDDSVGGSYDLYVMNADGSGMTRLTDSSRDETNPVWSPDGTRLAYVVDNPDGTSEIFTMKADGTGKAKLTDGVHDLSPAWSPDGSKIAFVRGAADYDIYTVRPDGIDLKKLTNFSGYEEMPVWSPDGSRIAFLSSQAGETELDVMNADGTGVAKLTDAPTDRPECCVGRVAWSPDGTTIAFGVYGDGNWDLYAVNADGTEQMRLTSESGDEVSPIWAPNGSKIAFLASPAPSSEGDNGGTFDVYTMESDGTGLTELTSNGRGLGGGLGWQPVPLVRETSGPTDTPTPTETLAETVTIDPTVVTDVPVGDFPSAITTGEGSVWVAVESRSDDGNEVARIDPATNEVTQTITTDGPPRWLGIGDGSLWIALDHLVQRIDPETGQMIAEIRGPGSFLTFTRGAVWAVDSANSIARIDSTTGEVVATVSLGLPASGYITGPPVGTPDAVWIMTFRGGDAPGGAGGELLRVDPNTNSVVARIDLEASTAFGVGDTAVWAVATYGPDSTYLTRIDAGTNETGSSVIVEGGWTPFAVGAGRLWLMGGMEPEIRLAWLDLGTLTLEGSIVVGELPAFEGSGIYDPATDTIWVAPYEGSVTRVDLRSTPPT